MYNDTALASHLQKNFGVSKQDGHAESKTSLRLKRQVCVTCHMVCHTPNPHKTPSQLVRAKSVLVVIGEHNDALTELTQSAETMLRTTEQLHHLQKSRVGGMCVKGGVEGMPFT